MRFLGDIPIARATLEYLDRLGHEAIAVRDRLSATASDAEIIRLAVAENCTILCFDLDFATLVALSGESLPSVITFRTSMHQPAYINQRLHAVLPDLVDELEQGVLVTVEDSRVRVRSLPATGSREESP